MLRKFFDNIEEIITVPLMVLLLLVLTWQIVTRWLFNDPSLWSEELARVLFMYMSLIGCAIASSGYARQYHFFSDKLPEKSGWFWCCRWNLRCWFLSSPSFISVTNMFKERHFSN